MYRNCLAARNVYLFIYYLFICLSIPELFLHVHHTLIKSKAPPLAHGSGIIVYIHYRVYVPSSEMRQKYRQKSAKYECTGVFK
jgi:hypothetical protein